MNDLKKRIGRIEKQLGTAEDGPRTVADIVKWTVDRQDAAGRLSPADLEKSNFYFCRLFAEAEARDAAGGRPGFGAKPARRRE